MTEDFQEDFPKNDHLESDQPEEAPSETGESERQSDASEQQQISFQPVGSQIFETGPDDLENAFEVRDPLEQAVQEYNNTSSPYIEDDSLALIQPATVEDNYQKLFPGEGVIENGAEEYPSPVDDARIDSPFQEEIPALLDNLTFQEAKAIFENPSDEFIIGSDEIAPGIPQQEGSQFFEDRAVFDENEVLGGNQVNGDNFYPSETNADISFQKPLDNSLFVETDPGDLERSFEDALMVETSQDQPDFSGVEAAVLTSPSAQSDIDDLEVAFEKASPIQNQQGIITEAQNTGDQERVETVREETHRGYIVAHDRMGFYSLKDGISMEDAERLIAEREEEIRSASTLEAQSPEQKIGDDIRVGEIEETPTNQDPAGEIGAEESLQEIEQAPLLGDEADSEVAKPEPDVTGKITSLIRAEDTTNVSPYGIEAPVLEPSQENQEEKTIEVGEISTSTPIDFYAETLSDSSTLAEGDWGQNFTTAAKLYPERAFEQAVYFSDTPSEVKDVVEEMISEVPPSHLAGISECEVHMSHDSEQITMETRRIPGGGLKLCLYFPEKINPDYARELIYTKVATHVENLLRNGCLLGRRDWIEIERRLEPGAPVSFEAQEGVDDKFMRLYMLNRTNAPLLKTEFTSEEPYWFMQRLDNQTTLEIGVES